MSRIDIIGQNGGDGIHYDEVGESYHDKIKRIAGEDGDDTTSNETNSDLPEAT